MPSLPSLGRCLPAVGSVFSAVCSSAFFVPFAFSLYAVAVLGAKSFLLAHYARFVSPLSFVFFLPTFFSQDAVAICVARALLLQSSSRLVSAVQGVLGMLFAVVFWGAAASEIGFYVNTGAEVEWKATLTLMADPAAVKVLGSGRKPVIIAALLMFLLALALHRILYNKLGDWLGALWAVCFGLCLRVTSKVCLMLGRKPPAIEEWQLANKETPDEENGPSYTAVDGYDSDDWGESAATLLPNTAEPEPPAPPSKWARLWKIVGIFFVCWLFFLHLVRPSKPHNHMSATLPYKMLDIFSSEGDYCEAVAEIDRNVFPLPELLASGNWHKPEGHFRGWAPGVKNRAVSPYAIDRPDWLSDPVQKGFERWNLGIVNETAGAALMAERGCALGDRMYDPVVDPLRISNANDDILPELKKVFDDNSVTVTHVLVIMMESIRWDVFPVRKGSHLHDMVLEPNDEADYDDINEKLALVSPNAEWLTGVSGGWNESLRSGQNITKDGPGMGGITVAGSISPSSYSAKSILGATCGCSSLVKDFFEEHKHDLYQPCFPHVFKLFNENRDSNKTDSPRVQDRKWNTVWMQASTDDWDHQNKFTKQMGFDQLFFKKDLKDSNAKYYPPSESEVNYFGYADEELKPYLRDYMLDAVEKNERLFLGSITATSHHPWDTPNSFERTRYVPDGGILERYKVLNNYLNAVKYDDMWLGTIFELLEETGIANETMVVMAGDHGLGFPADTDIRGTYGNSHISNFRVPLVLHHPQLPRIQINTNASSLNVLPTVLDLLINSGSIDEKDASIAGDLINSYEGQSLLRPFKASDGDRQQWNMGVLNPGGQMLSIVSHAVPWRLVIPVEKEVAYRFTNLDLDPEEESPVEDWSLSGLVKRVKKQESEKAAKWVEDAEAIAQWWLKENRALWDFNGQEKEEEEEDENAKRSSIPPHPTDGYGWPVPSPDR